MTDHNFEMRQELKTSSVLNLKQWLADLFDQGEVRSLTITKVKDGWMARARLTAKDDGQVQP